MGGFCVFGVSRSICRKQAEKKTLTWISDGEKRIELTVIEWGERVAAAADKLFNTTEKRVKISPEFDAPQFCRDWINVAPGEVRETKIMARLPKINNHGAQVMRNGAVVTTWVGYSERMPA